MARILVLGSTGMLGQTLLRVLTRAPSLLVEGTQHRDRSDPLYLDAEQGVEGLQALFERHGRYDYLINAIGVTSSYIDASDSASIRRAICINALFPYALASVAEGIHARVLHVSTDGVFSGKAASYNERAVHDCTDVYGKTKSLGEVPGPHVLTLRCSIIGPDPLGRRGLLEWFLSQPDGAVLTGYTEYLWNGVTTLQLSQLCERIITGDRFDVLRIESPVHHLCPNVAVSKYELLWMFQRMFDKSVTIRPSSASTSPVRRVLTTCLSGLRNLTGWDLNMEDAVRALRDFMASECALK